METRKYIEERLSKAWDIDTPLASASIERNIIAGILLDIRDLLQAKDAEEAK